MCAGSLGQNNAIMHITLKNKSTPPQPFKTMKDFLPRC